MMSSEILERIASVEFEAEIVASTPRVLRELLRRSRDVIELRERYDGGFVADETLRGFVDLLLERGASCARFPHQIALSAIAVMLEDRFTAFAGEYLSDLARIRSDRFSMASRVAHECLRARMSATQNAHRVFPPVSDISDLPLTFSSTNPQFGRQSIDTSRQTYTAEVA